jgi:hypothetical protein
LRGQILEKIGQPQNAEEYWRQQLAQAKDSYQRGLFETALSNHLAIKQDYSAFIGKKLKLLSRTYREILLPKSQIQTVCKN